MGGDWQWLVRQLGHDVAEGAVRAVVDAQREPETAAFGPG
jgi:hypothetical protein